MTNIEIREYVVNRIIDGIKIEFDDCSAGTAERICIFAYANTTEEGTKQKAVIDDIVNVLTQNSYEITLNKLSIEKNNGNITTNHSVILRSK